jgi:hypothetical protein
VSDPIGRCRAGTASLKLDPENPTVARGNVAEHSIPIAQPARFLSFRADHANTRSLSRGHDHRHQHSRNNGGRLQESEKCLCACTFARFGNTCETTLQKLRNQRARLSLCECGHDIASDREPSARGGKRATALGRLSSHAETAVATASGATNA